MPTHVRDFAIAPMCLSAAPRVWRSGRAGGHPRKYYRWPARPGAPASDRSPRDRGRGASVARGIAYARDPRGGSR